MTAKDIRWIQRFNNFQKAFGQLSDAVELAAERELTDLEKQGLIQAFEYTHELAWNTLKDFLENRGVQNIYGSRDASREAFQAGLIKTGETWMDMITSRNQTTHTYDEATVEEIKNAILNSYYFEFEALKATLEQLKAEESS
jgi:nucleotidyltransferase substrate binding protein (TIGR01987 family)